MKLSDDLPRSAVFVVSLALAMSACSRNRAPTPDSGNASVVVTARNDAPPMPPTAVAVARDPLPCFAGPGKPATGVNLELRPSRLRGAAPFVVFFDTNGTVWPGIPRPFHELGYCWSFGDEGSGHFATTGHAKNQAKGPLAAHVFEKPGSYTVTVSARDVHGATATKAVTILVEDPNATFAGTNTLCVSRGGNFAGCPAGAEKITASDISTLSSAWQPQRRVLLRRGDRFVATRSIVVAATGPGMIGAYGDGDRPVIDAGRAQAFTLFAFGQLGNARRRATDWRIVDLDLSSSADMPEDGGPCCPQGPIAVDAGTGVEQFLALRLRIVGFRSGINAADNSPAGSANVFAIQDTEVRDGGGALSYVAARRFVFLGNVYKNSKWRSMVRIPLVSDGVFSENDLLHAEQSEGGHALYLHAPDYPTEGQLHSERVVISDNLFRRTGGWTAYLGPASTDQDGRLRDFIFERNFFFLSGPRTGGKPIAVRGVHDLTIRDNLFDISNPGEGQCIELNATTHRLLNRFPERVTIAHNTCFSGSAPVPSVAGIDPGARDVRLFNNLIVGARAELFRQGGGTPKEHAGNRLIEGASSVFSATAPKLVADFAPKRGGQAVDSGDVRHSTFWDFEGRPRPIDGDGSGNAAPDVGALELVAP